MSTGKLKNPLELVTSEPPPPPPSSRPPGRLFSDAEAEAIARSAAHGELGKSAVELQSEGAAERKSRAKKPLTDSGYRGGSRVNPYEKKGGAKSIRQQFYASEEFDRLWRKLPGALPRGVRVHEWVEKVLTRAIRAQIERGEG